MPPATRKTPENGKLQKQSRHIDDNKRPAPKTEPKFSPNEATSKPRRSHFEATSNPMSNPISAPHPAPAVARKPPPLLTRWQEIAPAMQCGRMRSDIPILPIYCLIV
jgi:hypothetical protein